MLLGLVECANKHMLADFPQHDEVENIHTFVLESFSHCSGKICLHIDEELSIILRLETY